MPRRIVRMECPLSAGPRLRAAIVPPCASKRATAALFLFLAALAGPASAAEPAPPPASEPIAAADLAELSLEQLADIRVTSVSRRNETLSDVAASVYVITSEDIRRSGATTIPEVLRLVPTLQVARADANQYAITARGFNSVLANKMLVLIDERTVYSPLFSGVFWEAQDVVLADVDRIEVISGPAGTSWGTNAVNGIINIITRSAADTHGPSVSVGSGVVSREDEGDANVRAARARFGWGMGSSLHARVYGKVLHQMNSELENGTPVRDGAHRWLGGMRARWDGVDQTALVEVGGLGSRIDQVPDHRDVGEVHVLARWMREPPSGARWRVQGYWEHITREQPGTIDDELDTWNVEFQHEFDMGRVSTVWGAGFRSQRDDAEALGPALALIPEERTLEYGQVFAESEVRLARRLDLIAGVRAERNSYTRWEWLPTARLRWRPASSHLLWGAVSRAVRAPSRVDREFFIPAAPPFFALAGGAGFDSEVLRAVELGYRGQPFSALSWSLVGFFHEYDRLRTVRLSPAGPVFANDLDATTQGLETWANLRVASWWRLSVGGATGRRDSEIESGAVDLSGRTALGIDAAQWWLARSAFDLRTGLELDLMARRIGGLASSRVPHYATLDARLGWRFVRDLELSVSAHNLVGPRHVEWGVPGNRAEFGRSVFARLQWRP